MKWIRRLGKALGALVVMLAVALGAVYVRVNMVLARHETATVPMPPIDYSPAAIARGEHLVHIMGCTECHGMDLGGKMIVDNPAIGTLCGANLTKGQGGRGRFLSEGSIVRALRHGLSYDGRVLVVMPAVDYVHLGAADTAAVVAYLRSVAPVNHEVPPIRIGPLARVLSVAGVMKLCSFDEVPQVDPGFVRQPPVAPTVDYGRYVATVVCAGCHNPHFTGGPIHGAPPDWPPTTSITRRGLTGWTQDDFVRVLRTGHKPDGQMVNEHMPWRITREMTDDEITALWSFLQTVSG